jgi:D-amino-acid dehydrogenase
MRAILCDMAPQVVVIGGGAVGVCCAHELVRRGYDVMLLERGAELAAGCSAGNAGLICPSHSTPIANPTSLRNGLKWMLRPDSPFYLRPRVGVLPWLARFTLASRAARASRAGVVIRAISLDSLELHAELAEQGLDTGFERRGTMNVYSTAEGFAGGRAEAEEAGLPVEVLGPEETLELEPSLAEPIVGSTYYPREAHVDPFRFVHAVGAASGATIRTGVEVVALRRRNGAVAVETSEGTLEPETVVLAAGAWSGRLARSAGVFLPLEGGKGYHVDFERGEGDPRIPAWLQSCWAIATPLRDRLRIAGTLELSGLDLGVSDLRVRALQHGAERGFRTLEGRRVLEVWSGLRPCTPDGMPVIGRAPGLPGLVLATGHAMKGVALAPVTSRLVAEIVAGDPPSHDLAPFRPERFRRLLPRTAR